MGRSILQAYALGHKNEAHDFARAACGESNARTIIRARIFATGCRDIGATVPIGTAVHDRTSKLCESMNYREWSGYYAVGVYEMHHEHEYNAIRNA